MINLEELIFQIAKIPSFTTFEDRLWMCIEQCTAKLPVTVKRISENNCVISWSGNRPDLRPVALTAHLDKINHFEVAEIGDLAIAQEDDELVGQLDDAVGVAICLYVLVKSIQTPDCPPILVLLSEMEEKGSYRHKKLLKNGGGGIELSPGSYRIADHLIDNTIIPDAVITVDTSAVFRKTGGVAVYTDFWEQSSTEPSSQTLRAKTSELFGRILKIYPEVLHSNGINDYITYGMKFNEELGSSVPSIAIEPAIWPIHAIGERMKVSDIHRVSSIILKLLETWRPLEG